MAETKRIRFLVPRGSVIDGAVIQRGAVIDFPAFWADRFIADGTAVLVETEPPPPAKPKKNNDKKGKS